MAEPKKCPFCGRILKVEDCGTNRFFVKCECGIAQDKLYFQRCDAIRRWNTRRQQPERKKGKWTKDCACEICGFKPWYERDIHTLSFCPNCGASMKGESDV